MNAAVSCVKCMDNALRCDVAGHVRSAGMSPQPHGVPCHARMYVNMHTDASLAISKHNEIAYGTNNAAKLIAGN